MIAFATGVMDVVTFPDYHVFASNQTGNTALLTLGALNIADEIIDTRHLGTSLRLFAAGCFFGGQVGNYLGCRRRAWLLISSVLQTSLIVAGAGSR